MPLQKKLCEIVLLIGLLQWNSDTQVRIRIRILKIGSGSSDSSKGTLRIHTVRIRTNNNSGCKNYSTVTNMNKNFKVKQQTDSSAKSSQMLRLNETFGCKKSGVKSYLDSDSQSLSLSTIQSKSSPPGQYSRTMQILVSVSRTFKNNYLIMIKK